MATIPMNLKSIRPQFSEAYPQELLQMISPADWNETINAVNKEIKKKMSRGQIDLYTQIRVYLIVGTILLTISVLLFIIGGIVVSSSEDGSGAALGTFLPGGILAFFGCSLGCLVPLTFTCSIDNNIQMLQNKMSKIINGLNLKWLERNIAFSFHVEKRGSTCQKSLYAYMKIQVNPKVHVVQMGVSQPMYQPPLQTYPPNQAYPPPTQTYQQPPLQTYPPTQAYQQPPTQTYPQQSYPPNYAPPPQMYAPPSQSTYPPTSQNYPPMALSNPQPNYVVSPPQLSQVQQFLVNNNLEKYVEVFRGYDWNQFLQYPNFPKEQQQQMVPEIGANLRLINAIANYLNDKTLTVQPQTPSAPPKNDPPSYSP